MKPFANSSQLSNKVNVMKKDSTNVDEWGNPRWNIVGVCWCEVRDRAGSETLITAQNKRVSSAKTTFTMRTTSLTQSITADMKFDWRGFSFGILSGPIYSDDRNFVSFETERQF